MSDVNLVLMQGRLTREPELRATKSGAAVCDISIASNRFVRRKGKDAEGYDQYTTYARVTLWNQMAERYVKQLHTGDMIFVEGQLVDDSYEDKKTGVKHNGRLKIDGVTRVNVLAKAGEKTESTPTETVTPAPEV